MFLNKNEEEEMMNNNEVVEGNKERLEYSLDDHFNNFNNEKEVNLEDNIEEDDVNEEEGEQDIEQFNVVHIDNQNQ